MIMSIEKFKIYFNTYLGITSIEYDRYHLFLAGNGREFGRYMLLLQICLAWVIPKTIKRVILQLL